MMMMVKVMWFGRKRTSGKIWSNQAVLMRDIDIQRHLMMLIIRLLLMKEIGETREREGMMKRKVTIEMTRQH
ncbi:hypothetical protein MtrunA17_Chr6g0451091 [Medicago truncatula]|uniref:Uncharacterized protein n=1 Tax=Medicago truncatula TaxID=3880 RepID=A0A396HEY5_MEDTR|nr:hypothetical protein MtrunA17_Chr6g0451091 [Medicago truncatula]